MNIRLTAAHAHRREAPRARLVIMEDGAPPVPLPWASGGPETTIVVGPGDAPSHDTGRRIDRRITEIKRGGRVVGEVLFVLAARGGTERCSTRLSALLTVTRHLESSPHAEMTLILPAEAASDLRHEVFALAEVLFAELGAGASVRVRFGPERWSSSSRFSASNCARW